MRITEAARRLGTSPRMLRYRESLGLLPDIREHPATARAAGPAAEGAPLAPPAPHRRFDERDLEAVALGLAIERRYDVSPAALAFGLRVLAESGVRAEVAELARRIGRIRPPAARALDFEQERAQRLLNMPAASGEPPRPPRMHL
jgi:hypothetical protein